MAVSSLWIFISSLCISPPQEPPTTQDALGNSNHTNSNPHSSPHSVGDISDKLPRHSGNDEGSHHSWSQGGGSATTGHQPVEFPPIQPIEGQGDYGIQDGGGAGGGRESHSADKTVESQQSSSQPQWEGGKSTDCNILWLSFQWFLTNRGLEFRVKPDP